MRAKRNLLAVAAFLVACIVAWFATSIKGGERIYEVHPDVYMSEYRTDAARAIDAYERLMERYIELTEKNLTSISTDLKVIVVRLDSIDSKLEDLSARITGIEKALGIEQPKPPQEQPSSPNQPSNPASEQTKLKTQT